MAQQPVQPGGHIQAAAATPPLSQAAFLPRRARVHIPPTGKSADAAGEVEADDGFRYVVKKDVAGGYIRASEWICARLSQRVGIVAPQQAVIEMISGELLFGSQILAGVGTVVETGAFLMTPTHVNGGRNLQALLARRRSRASFHPFTPLTLPSVTRIVTWRIT